MDHNERIRGFQHVMERQAEHAHAAAIELEALVPLLPNEKIRQLAREQIKASQQQAREFRELVQKIKET